MQEYGISWNTMPIFRISSTISPVTNPSRNHYTSKLLAHFLLKTLAIVNSRKVSIVGELPEQYSEQLLCLIRIRFCLNIDIYGLMMK